VTASSDHTARIWDAATGREVCPPLEHQGTVVGAAFSLDGARIVTASADHTARVWDAASGKLLATPLEHQGLVWNAAFSPDGTRVVTASWDNTARIWEARLDERTLTEWSALAERSPFVLSNGVFTQRTPRARSADRYDF
jgi:WD40 repeat protein